MWLMSGTSVAGGQTVLADWDEEGSDDAQ